NSGDAWALVNNADAGAGYTPVNGTLDRPDWNGLLVQVGIAQGAFSAAGRDALFSDFELSGTNVSIPVTMPPAPTSLVTSSPNPNGSLTFSWTTNGGNGSILIIRRTGTNGVLIANPIHGVDYSRMADSNFSTNRSLIAGATHVVYAGSATSVTVSGLGGSNNIYKAEVLSYDSVSGPSIVYNTANPATLSFLGTGLPSAVASFATPTNVPAGGAALLQVIATFTTGEQVDVTKDPNVVLTSSNPSIAFVDSGILNAVSVGTVNVVSSYAGFSGTNTITVIAPRFTDNFGTAHDYLTNGLPGSGWDGVYLRPGDLPGANNGGDT